MGNTTFAGEMTAKKHTVAKDRKHHKESNSSNCNGAPRGNRGKRGHHGERGHHGKHGHRGHRGNSADTAGPMGDQGPQGPQGPQGIPGTISAINTFISAAWLLPAVGSTPQINQGQPIPFNTLVDQGGLTTPYVLNSGVFQVNETGHYEVTFAAKWTTSTPIALRIDDGTTVTIPTASLLLVTDDYATMSLIVPVTVVGTTFEIIPAPPPVGGGFLTFPLQGTAPSTHATFTIKKIADL